MRPLAFGLRMLALFALYVATARLGLELDAVSGFATLVWPPTGLSLAALVVFGRRWWPAIAAGAFVANVMNGAPVAVAAGIAVGNTLEAVVGAWLLENRRFEPAIAQVRDAVHLIAIAIIATSISASIGVVTLWAGGVIDAAAITATARAWWIGDMLGVIVVATFAMVWLSAPRPALTRARVVEAFAATVVLVVISLYVFDVIATASSTSIRTPYFVFPALIFLALRFRQHGATGGTLVVWISAIVATVLGLGPFARESLSEGLLPLQMFMAAVAGSTLFLGAAVSERDMVIRAREEFLAIASHELRTPLTTIGLTITSLRERADTLPPEKLRARLELLDRQSERVSLLVGNLLDVSRIMSAQLDLAREPVNVGEVVLEVVARFREQATAAGSELVVEVGDPVQITTDRVRLEQVVTNLLGNALKFGGGKPIEITVVPSTSTVSVRVRDHGIGIARRDHERIFQRFERVATNRGKGLGLGLWIVRQIVDAMGGSIAVESELGQGTLIAVTLPRDT